MKMQIVETNIWKTSETIWIILKEVIDPFPAINSKFYALYKAKNLVSICAVKKWKNALELGVVITKKQYRGKGYATKLLCNVLRKYSKIYLLCNPKREEFYNRLGFKKVRTSPAAISYRVYIANIFRGLFALPLLIMMKRVSRRAGPKLKF